MVTTFEETNSRKATRRHGVSFVLTPGKYKVFLELTDLDTKKHLVRKKEVTLKNFATGRFRFSDIIFAEAAEFDATGLRQIAPNFLKTYSDPASPLLAYFEVVTPSVRDTITFRFTIFDSENQTVTSDTKTMTNASVYRDTLNLSRRVTEPGQYVLALEAGEGRDKALVRETFTIQWSPNPVAVPDIDLAIEQLRYIARSNELEEMKKATQAERRKLFEEFWKKRDPTPDTPENELFLEYYRRVDYANRHFSVYPMRKDGWLTDRGRIYIIYGPPTDVERRAADLNTPAYELWYYRHLERRFIFEDRSGLGEYQLVRAE